MWELAGANEKRLGDTMRIIAAASVCAMLGACSTIIEGRSQQVFINSNPIGADCGLYRQGMRIATVQNPAGSTLIEKSQYDIWIACVKAGYQMATYYNPSGGAGASLGNILLGGGIGCVVDRAQASEQK